jgi:diguanylate cyclase (GGDEF)-like protein
VKSDPANAAVASVTAAFQAALRSGRREPLPPALQDDEQIAELLDEVADLTAFALAVAQGDLARTLSCRGSLAGALKALQAALLHLTWQTQRVAAGDFSQRVDFMGEFSQAFNSMVVALDDARRQLAQQNDELHALALTLEEMASTDELTKAFNRRKFDQLIEAEVTRGARYSTSLSLLMLDIDHFKRVNETFGHEAGDAVLVAIAALVRSQIRAADSLARWGGEEFVVLMPAVDALGAAALAERIRAGVASHDFGPVGQVTVSLGVAQYCAGETSDQLFARVDAALYRAKDGGRNRVESAPSGACQGEAQATPD